MILIDTVHINNGGGKTLLNYLIEKLESTDYKILYLFDERFENTFSIKKENQVVNIKPSLLERKKFYKSHKTLFSKIFILGNIPPPIKLHEAKVYTYFHNAILLSVPKEFNAVEKIKYFIKVKILQHYKKNTDFWILQSNFIKEKFISKYKQLDKIMVIPFFPSISDHAVDNLVREKGSFLYVSNAQPNKNHIKLIDAFCIAYDKLKKGKLVVTVNENFPHIIEKINNAKKSGYPVENIGFVDRLNLKKQYLQSEFVIFPSLSESFGLGLLEGIELDCKILGADLPYTYAVCKPSLVFNPDLEDSISNCIEIALESIVNKSEIIVRDQINDLLNLLKE